MKMFLSDTYVWTADKPFVRGFFVVCGLPLVGFVFGLIFSLFLSVVLEYKTSSCDTDVLFGVCREPIFLCVTISILLVGVVASMQGGIKAYEQHFGAFFFAMGYALFVFTLTLIFLVVVVSFFLEHLPFLSPEIASYQIGMYEHWIDSLILVLSLSTGVYTFCSLE